MSDNFIRDCPPKEAHIILTCKHSKIHEPVDDLKN